MFCATCNLEYPDHLNFCRRCGQTLVRALGERVTESVCCTRCGARVVHGEKFCQHCGTREGAVAQETVVGLCQNCNTYWRNSWQYCKSCGIDRDQALQLNAVTPGQQSHTNRTSTEAEPNQQTRKCPYCSVTAQAFSLFCEHCGMRLAPESAENTEEASPLIKHGKQTPVAMATRDDEDSLSRLDDLLLDDPLSQPSDETVKAPAHSTLAVNPAPRSSIIASPPAASQPAYPPLRLQEKPRETEALAPPNPISAQLVTLVTGEAVSSEARIAHASNKAANPQSWRAAIKGPTESSESKASAKPSASPFSGEAWLSRRPGWHIPLLLGSVLLGSFLLVGIWRKAQSAKETPPSIAKPQTTNPTTPAGMAYIPGGKFEMGRLDGTAPERPTRSLEIKAFFLDRTEVTNQQYLALVEATGKRPPSHWRAGKPLPSDNNLPVVNVTWQDANDFAAWANKRLPTEEEWEFAARGTDERLYPWGKAWEPSFANTAEGNATKVVEVGRYLAGSSPYGVVDMCGNVWEWTSSQWRSYGTQEVLEEGVMVIRGGAYDSPKEFATTTYRGAVLIGKPYPKTGFRCAKDLP